MGSWGALAELPGAVDFVEVVFSSVVLVILTFQRERIQRTGR
jgi:hypothetical protein